MLGGDKNEVTHMSLLGAFIQRKISIVFLSTCSKRLHSTHHSSKQNNEYLKHSHTYANVCICSWWDFLSGCFCVGKYMYFELFVGDNVLVTHGLFLHNVWMQAVAELYLKLQSLCYFAVHVL